MTLSVSAFAAITYFQSKIWFLVIYFVARLFQGTAAVAIQVTIYSTAAIFYPDKKQLMIGLLEAAAGLGMMLGPLLGTLLFAIGGYNFMFYSFGSFFLILAALLHFLLPKNIDLYTS